MFHYVYILQEINGKRTYVGYTNNLERRLRQHNGEIKGGAKYTRGRKWEFMGYIEGFPDKIIALQCEWKIKHCGIRNREKAVEFVLNLDKMTNNSIILNKDMSLKWIKIDSNFNKITNITPNGSPQPLVEV